MIKLEKTVIHLLNERGQTLSVAESCTGGLLSHRLTNVPGSSTCFLGGVISYANQAKSTFLGVPPPMLNKHGAVSKAVAQAMETGIRTRTDSDFSLAITGIAGPGGGTATKPVGLVFIALSTPQKTTVHRYHFTGTRLQIKTQSVNQALRLLIQKLQK